MVSCFAAQASIVSDKAAHTGVPGRAPGYLNTPDGMDFLPFKVAMETPAIRRVVLR